VGKGSDGLTSLMASTGEALASAHKRRGDGPAGGDVGRVERVDVFSACGVCMCDRIDLQESWFVLVPVCESANGDLVLEQIARLCGWAAIDCDLLSGWGQEAVDGGGAHREQ